jgi:hypothetical protein
VNGETKEQSKQWMHTHSPNKPKRFKQPLSVHQKADCNCFLGQEKSADGGIHAKRDNNNIRIALRNTKRNCVRPLGTKGVEYSSMTILVPIQLLALEHCWSISTGSCLTTILNSPDLTPNDYHLKNWWRSQRFNNNEELTEDVKTWLRSQAADFFDTGMQKLIPRYDKCLSSGGYCVEKELKYVRIFCI